MLRNPFTRSTGSQGVFSSRISLVYGALCNDCDLAAEYVEGTLHATNGGVRTDEVCNVTHARTAGGRRPAAGWKAAGSTWRAMTVCAMRCSCCPSPSDMLHASRPAPFRRVAAKLLGQVEVAADRCPRHAHHPGLGMLRCQGAGVKRFRHAVLLRVLQVQARGAAEGARGGAAFRSEVGRERASGVVSGGVSVSAEGGEAKARRGGGEVGEFNVWRSTCQPRLGCLRALAACL
eukprot:365145-Chlamydomonas_euryale.AAC.8